MANTYKALSTVTVGAGGAASIDFTNIPATYTDLVLLLSVRSSQALANPDGLAFQFNNDTSSNYTQIQLFGTGAAVGSNRTTQNFAYVGPVVGASNTANTFGSVLIYIPNYVSSAAKVLSVDSVTENNATGADQGIRGNIWNSTAPIRSIKFYDYVTGNLVQYSTATLYGVFNADVNTAPTTPTIGTATAGNSQASITFTGVSNAASYTMTSTPGSFTATSTTSPIVVTGLTNGTSYTFKVKAENPFGASAESAASNSVTPAAQPIPSLGAWTTAATTVPSTGGDSYYGWVNVGGSPRVFAFGSSRSDVSYYNDGFGGTWTQSGSARPTGQGLGSSSKSLTNSNLFYTYGGDTGTQNLVYSTSTGATWTQQNNISYNAGWSDGCYFTQSGNHYLIAAADYPSGTPAARASINSDGTLNWGNITSYPTYAAAPRFARLTSVAIGMGGFTSTSLSARQANVYSYNAAGNSWTSQTSLPFTPGGGYFPAFSLTGPIDSRIYIANGTSMWSRGDSSGTWVSETATPNTWAVGWGTITSGGNLRVQVTNAGQTYIQQLA